MPISLAGTRVQDTYKQILHVDTTLDGNLKTIYDGDGTASVLSLSTTKVGISALSLGGTDITSSAVELNYLDGSIAGTAVASKAVVLDANKKLDEMGLGSVQFYSTSPSSVTAGGLRYDGSDLYLGYSS